MLNSFLIKKNADGPVKLRFFVSKATKSTPRCYCFWCRYVHEFENLTVFIVLV